MSRPRTAQPGHPETDLPDQTSDDAPKGAHDDPDDPARDGSQHVRTTHRDRKDRTDRPVGGDEQPASCRSGQGLIAELAQEGDIRMRMIPEGCCCDKTGQIVFLFRLLVFRLLGFGFITFGVFQEQKVHAEHVGVLGTFDHAREAAILSGLIALRGFRIILV